MGWRTPARPYARRRRPGGILILLKRSRLAQAIVLIAIAAAALWRLPVTDVGAHAALIKSNPANGEKVSRPPARVTLNFSEPIERRLTKIEVTDKDRNRVDDGEIAFDDSDPAFASIGVKDLAPGLYIVQFDNVSTVDGHPWSGVIQFIVLNPDGSVPAGAEFTPADEAGGGTTGLLPSNIDAALKWIALLSLATMAGGAFFLVAVARPAAAFLGEAQARKAVALAESWLVNFGHVLLPAAFICMMVLVLRTVSRFETSTSLGTYLLQIQAGRYRSVFLVSSVVALAGIDLLGLSSKRRVQGVALFVTLGASLVALYSFSATSHGGVGAGSFWAETSDYIHLLATAAWLGALAMLLPLLIRLKREISEPEARFLFLANALDRFSLIAGLSVIAVLATGVFNGLAQIPAWDAFTDTTYGRVLLAKLALVAALLPVAGLNAFVLKPRIVRSIDRLYQEGSAAADDARDTAGDGLARLQRLLRAVVVGEVALVLAVLASVAVLTQTSTAKGEIAAKQAATESSGGFQDQKPAGDLNLEIAIKPNRVGLNQFSLRITGADGAPLNDAEQVRLRFFYTDPSNPSLSTGQTELILNRFGDGLYQGSGAYFSQPGSWRVEAGIRRAATDDVSRNFVVSVAPAQSSAGGGGGRFALPFTSLNGYQVGGALLALLGVVVWIYAMPLSRSFQWDLRLLAALGAACLIAGGVLAFALNPGDEGGDLAQENPIKPTAASIERGRTLFQQNCVVCHGADGRGDGPQAASLDPAPSDFRLHVPLHTDPQFYAFIADGFPGSAMPAWKDQLSEEDIWNLVNFLRAEFKEAPSARAP